MPNSIPEDAKNLITSLLVLNPDDRLGAIDIKDLMIHPFFKDIDFEKINE